MWIARFKIWHVNSSMRLTTGKDVKCYNYFLNTFYKGKKLYANRVSLVFGPDAQSLIDLFKREKWIDVKCVEGNSMFFSHEVSSSFHMAFADGNMFFIKPILCKGGFEYWEIATWNKKYIKALIQRVKKVGKKTATIELLNLTNRTLSAFFSIASTNLTQKQLSALKAACAEGYYDVPRKASLEMLADKIGVKRT
ncbi:MAG: helix-turn-helix domain-containing protein, partial [Candidatus Micrarchaeota archaeon]